MKVICPVTGTVCPYDQKLDAGVCPREHECDIARAAYAKMLKKPPSARKPIYISIAVVLVIAIAAVLYFLVFDGRIAFMERSPGPTGSRPAVRTRSPLPPGDREWVCPHPGA